MDVAFPYVVLQPNENLDQALGRVLEAFKAEGFETRVFPTDPEWSSFARLFVALHNNTGFYFFFIANRDLSAEDENALLYTISRLSIDFRKKAKVFFDLYSPATISDGLKYVLADIDRFNFNTACRNLLSDRELKSSEDMDKLCLTIMKLLFIFEDRLAHTNSMTEVVEFIVMSILRTQKDPNAEESGNMPEEALSCLGVVLGQSICTALEKHEMLRTEWTIEGNEYLVSVFAKVNKGFLHTSEEIFILKANPIGKVFKLFINGSEDSVVYFQESMIAFIRHTLEEKGLSLK